MSSTYYRLYVNQVMQLAKTLVIKSQTAAEAVNISVMEQTGQSVNEDPRTWKYYMNLAGLYHHTDLAMTITSMDTLEEIVFNKENLTIHRATAQAYQYGTRYYRDLLARYPDQETLIMGVLNDLSLDTIVDAADGAILHYDRGLIEPQEESLVRDVERWVQSYLYRWNVSGYSVTDELYPAALLGMLYINLPITIMNLRTARCGTNEVHSFHIREFLASHGRLDVYMSYLTLGQQLFLYRNIRYIERRVGQTHIFQWLIERIVNEHRLPLARYDAVQRSIDVLENLRPLATMERVALNQYPDDGSDGLKSVAAVLEKQWPMADRNAEVHYERLDTIKEAIEMTPMSRLPTKTIESALLDTTNSVPFTWEETLINHWAYLAHSQRFSAVVNVSNPKTGANLQMTAREAFLTYLYAVNAANGLILDRIPLLTAQRVQKPIQPTLSALQQQVDRTLVSDVWLAELKQRQPATGVYVSVLGFREYVRDVFVVQNQQRLWWSDAEDAMERAMKQSSAMSFYRDQVLDFGLDTDYVTWFSDKGWDFHELGPLDQDLLARDILNVIGGEDIGTSSYLADLQKQTLALMTQLSSYSVHYIQTINNTAYRIIDTLGARASDLDSRYRTHRHISLARVKPLSLGGTVHSRHMDEVYDRPGVDWRSVEFQQESGLADFQAGVDITADNHGSYQYVVSIGAAAPKILTDRTTAFATQVVQMPS